MNLFVLSLIGAVIILDKYAFGEFGISQPVVSGMIIGALFGDLASGIFLGAMLQLIFLGGLPIGRVIPPDGQAAGIIGCGSYFFIRPFNAAGHALFVAFVLALLGAIIGGIMELYTRRFNEKLSHLIMRKENCLSVCHLAGLVTAFLRGFFLFLPIFIVASSISIPALFPELSRESATIICVSIGLANGIYLFVKKTTIVYTIIGALCGLALTVF
ncbi:MAG: PTS sugar transporter subunit IIC [candidate division WOR-3 bacterium]|nr:MAG: PTS sugar transporter subunit IIC [candidate division WOR-3 bacterium]